MISLYLPGDLSQDVILDFLLECHRKYPYITEQSNLMPWCDKLKKNANAVCVMADGKIDSACFYYFNGDNKVGYITLIAVLGLRRSGVGGTLLKVCSEDLKKRGAAKIQLEVLRENVSALAFYVHNGFVSVEDRGDKFLMERILE